MDIFPRDIKQIIYNYDYAVNYTNLIEINISIFILWWAPPSNFEDLVRISSALNFLLMADRSAVLRYST